MEFVWDHKWDHPPAAEQRTAAAVGVRVLAGLREACAPNAPSKPVCEYTGDRRELADACPTA